MIYNDSYLAAGMEFTSALEPRGPQTPSAKGQRADVVGLGSHTGPLAPTQSAFQS